MPLHCINDIATHTHHMLFSFVCIVICKECYSPVVWMILWGTIHNGCRIHFTSFHVIHGEQAAVSCWRPHRFLWQLCMWSQNHHCLMWANLKQCDLSDVWSLVTKLVINCTHCWHKWWKKPQCTFYSASCIPALLPLWRHLHLLFQLSSEARARERQTTAHP